MKLHPQARAVKKLFFSNQKIRASEESDPLTPHAYISRRAPTTCLINNILSIKQKKLSIQAKVTRSLSSADLQKHFPHFAYSTKLNLNQKDSELDSHRIKHWHLKEDLLANKKLKKIGVKKEIQAVNNKRVILLDLEDSPLIETEQQNAVWEKLLAQKEKPYFQITRITHFLNKPLS